MDFADRYLQALGAVLAVLMGFIALANWLNRKHGGFVKGMAGAVFIAVCGVAAFLFIVLRVHS